MGSSVCIHTYRQPDLAVSPQQKVTRMGEWHSLFSRMCATNGLLCWEWGTSPATRQKLCSSEGEVGGWL